MELKVDTHTHTYASGHAYSTLIENAKSAKQNGLAMFCTTDHSESMPGAPHYWFFSNQRVLPRFIEGVAIIRGVESNIMNTQGEIDIHPSVDKNLDWVIASFHEPVFRPSDSAAHTEALLNVIKGGRVDALGHLGNPNFDFDFEAVIQCAVEHNVAIEINNTTLKGNSRVGSVDRCYEIARIAKAKGAFITSGSDAHFCNDVGGLDLVSSLLDKVGIDSNKVITHSPQQFLSFLALRGRNEIPEYSALV
ncbi:putative phosphatase VCHA50O413_v1_20744 [Vibrio chagasii]|jgi:putative hydrolase|uniref:phosphatase n=1 Tax=Vibrio chagasii TaxID=170679 RepID=UPI00337021F9|nr:putative phosphatase VCHA35O142_v1_10905 [Vibrio chagasii]CAH6885566.1 putative phosphatase VCHA34P114_v1_30162 [Vibrio chagasii]CAH6890821.1 putative phosphatase VCHA42P256_v1_100045 [Vibrio chagasii]CAH6904289.1 putative phosphatase VCHA48P434_v1_100042 [Vibrio chagasii]CAH6914369.1 putative phosphatase VCHA43P272_v1_120102 [Vibrio chagasii]